MHTAIEFLLSLIVGSVFGVAAGSKLRQPKRFVFTVLRYQVLPLWLGQLYGWLLPPLELLLALLILSGTAIRLVSITMLLLLLSFIGAVSMNMARGREFDCNCFGTTRQRKIGWKLLVQDVMLVGGVGILSLLTSIETGLAPWSLFRLLGLRSTNSPFAVCICVGLTLCIAMWLRVPSTKRAWIDRWGTRKQKPMPPFSLKGKVQ